jgi:hypothetical protein
MKRSSSWLVIAVLALLAGVSLYLYFFKAKYSTVEQDDRAFAFKDTAALTRIFIADKDGRKSLLERKNDGWYVNNNYKCRGDAVLNLLEVIKLVEVKMPVPKTGKENVLKFMSFNAIKVELYAGDEKVKQYYVGHETEDGEGSFMILSDLESGKNFENPYVCFIPGFRGYLLPRFIAIENDWRERIVMNYIPPDIKQIKVENNAAVDSSFVIELPSANSFALRGLSGNPIAFDEAKLKQYLVYYQNLSYESLVTGKNKRLTDSLSLTPPFQTITITRRDNQQDKFVFYRKPFDGTVTGNSAAKFDFDPDRFYMRFDGGRQWALSQYYVFGKLCVNASYFGTADSVKK